MTVTKREAAIDASVAALDRLVDFEVLDAIEDRGDSVMIEDLNFGVHVIEIEAVPAWIDGFLTGLRGAGIFPDERERLLNWLDAATA